VITLSPPGIDDFRISRVAPHQENPYNGRFMNPLNWSFRVAFVLGAALCAAFLGFALYSQFQMNLEPCPLCQLQRFAFIAVMVFCIAAAVHDPAGAGRRVYGALVAFAAAVGIAIAGRHVWLQHLPPDQVPECGPGLNYMLETLPLGAALKKALTGSGECAKVDWTFLGLSMPEWTLFWFVIIFVAALYYGFRRYRA
jgi:disulfide bond formation protein DsbB